MSGWSRSRVAERIEWAPGLVTLKLESPRFGFEPGQFVNLGLDVGGERTRRAYSLASAPGEAPEFYVSEVTGGTVSGLLTRSAPGDEIWLETPPQGFFTLRWLPESARELWLIATGTGLGPFVSLWRSGALFPRFEQVVVVHGVRETAQLGYKRELEELVTGEQRLRYRACVSRGQPGAGALSGRITSALSEGALERAVGLELDPARSHVMLCGNPEMIRDTSQILAARGLRKHRTRMPGHVTSENYW
jgi:ferredoxin--NADP+ reductase